MTGLGGTLPLGTAAPIGGSAGFSLTAGAAQTGLAGGAGLQLGGLQTGQIGLSMPKPAATSVATGLQLGQATAMKLPQPGQTGLVGLSQPQAASTAAPSLAIKPQTGLTGLTGTNTCTYSGIFTNTR